ncbi:MAG TPA: ribonuclease III [Burkholderiales bacterium]|nr:ribonuclease III [Burkholderiales bacterium]
MSRSAGLEERLGHRFDDSRLLEQALTHRSFGSDNNERLEFLGDGVLGCAVAEELYARFPGIPEGKLTRLRAGLVRREALAEVAQLLELAQLLRMGQSVAVTESIAADAVEALMGAIFVDGGYDAARAAVQRVFRPLFDRLDPLSAPKDAKTRLQELLQGRRRKLPEYGIVSESRRDRATLFQVECSLPELGLKSTGNGSSRQKAEQQAAAAMLEKLGR